MRLAILEDDASDQQRLLAYCARYTKDKGIKLAPTVSAALADMPTDMQTYDAALLDIMIQGQPAGVEAARALRALGWQGALVFITSSTDYYPEGFEVDAAHYLTKPLSYEDFCIALERISERTGLHARAIEVPLGGSRISVPAGDIISAEVFNKTTLLHLTNKRTLEVSLPLKELEALLGEGFLRCFRSCLVNLAQIDHLEDTHFVMKDGTRVPIALRNRQSIREAYLSYRVGALKGSAQ